MSGGYFNYNQSRIKEIATEIQLILDEEPDYSPETITEFKKAIYILNKAYIYAQRIDWLICGDDGEASFHRRLNEELKKGEKP